MSDLLLSVWKDYRHNVIRTVITLKKVYRLYEIYKRQREDAEEVIEEVQKKIDAIKESDKMFLQAQSLYRGRKSKYNCYAKKQNISQDKLEKYKKSYKDAEHNITAEPDWSFVDSFLNPYEKFNFIRQLRYREYKISRSVDWCGVPHISSREEISYIHCLIYKINVPKLLTPKFTTAKDLYYVFRDYDLYSNWDKDGIL